MRSIVIEYCSNCEEEVPVKTDGTSPCPNCGTGNVLPCSICDYRNEGCDWSEPKGCRSFPKQE